MPAEARLLLGRMEKDAAIRLLREDCVFDEPLTDEKAKQTWKCYKEAVDALPVREALALQRLALNEFEQDALDEFLTTHRKRGAQNILDVIKVNPRHLVVHQIQVVLDRVSMHSVHADAQTWYIKNCLGPAQPTQHQLPMRAGLNIVDYDIPHAEFAFSFVPGTGLVDIDVRIIRLYEQGHVTDSKALFYRLLPFLVFAVEHLELFIRMEKKVLMKRGVIASDRLRDPTLHLDDLYEEQMEELVDLGIHLAQWS